MLGCCDSSAERQITRGSKIPREIIPEDDAFHGSIRHIAAEWWYFDAIFTNNYSIHIGLKTFTKKNYGVISPLIEIYKNGQLEIEAKRTYPLKKSSLSPTLPNIKLSNVPILSFDHARYLKNKDWVYNVNLDLDSCQVNLDFIGTTRGWTFDTGAESWAVALPKACVTGEISCNGETINVEGVGYHDHNWNYTILTVMNYGVGWYWGKIASKSFNVVWAKIEKSSKREEIYAVVNKDNNSFYVIDPNKITVVFDKFVRNHLRKTPTAITVQIDDIVNDTPITVDVSMNAFGLHYNSVIIAPYWRYHVRSEGTISIGSHKETVNRTQIMELLKFS